MAPSLASKVRQTWKTLSSIKTGVVLIILVVIFSAAGTVILQRPMTEPDDMARAYSPAMLRFLDATGLTDVYHTRWFVGLMLLVCLSIIAASVERFPNAWRYFVRPYKSPDEGFRRVWATQAHVAITDEEQGLGAAERAFRHMHLKSERIVRPDRFSLFAERNRISEMAVYIVHTSLLLIFLGTIVDGLYGWRGFLMLTPGAVGNQVEIKNGATRTLPFSLRCDGTGEETYSDGTPKRWWSKLAVVNDGREISSKEIVVNDPLVYQGVRFYQASYGRTGKLDRLLLNAVPKNGAGQAREISLGQNQIVSLDADTKVQVAEFVPDFVVQDGHVYARSNDVVNPAVHLIVTSEKNEQSCELLAAGSSRRRRERIVPLQLRAERLEDGRLHWPGSLARTRPVGSVGRGCADGDRPDIRLLRRPRPVLGGSRAGRSRQSRAVDRRFGEPQPRRVRANLQTICRASRERTETEIRGGCGKASRITPENHDCRKVSPG